ncbi:MAG TPA: vWA domain-containing protein [Ktedonobacteraceae bacterium]|jgi:Mg-chelatase subunit ChlD|nr:vWA domain-containing protein [Ktedonobacteraceae bacterium]
MKKRDLINQVDLAFVVDTTGSMGHLITAAQNQMVSMLEGLSQAAEIDLRLGVVEYRDHPPQDKMVYKVYAFARDLQHAQKNIRGLAADGGGDMPEAVFDGIVAAINELEWRRHARRLLVLVGDAPPHGVGAQGDHFGNGCPCGETIESVTRRAEEKCITIHALGLTKDVQESFEQISAMTGGQFFPSQQAQKAIEHLATLLKSEFSDLELDRAVLKAWQEQPDITIDELVELTQRNRHAVSNAMVRLLSRELIEVPVTPA